MNNKQHTWKYQKNWFSILTAFLCLVIIGINFLPHLNVQLNPSRSLPNLRVTYQWPNASARIIEAEVTTKLEGLLGSVQGVESISSSTSKGYGSITVNFDKKVNIDAVRFEIASLVRQSYHNLPDQVTYPSLSLNAAGENVNPILTYTLNAPSSPFFIQKYAEENISPELSKIKGLGEVRIFGNTPYQWEISYDTEVINQMGITTDEIAASINDFLKTEEMGKGYFFAAGTKNEIAVLLEQQKDGKFNFEDIPIKMIDHHLVYLKDIATVRFKEKAPDSYFRVNGLNTINLVLYPEKGVNHLKLAEVIKENIGMLRASLPAGYSITLAHDESEFIRKELKTISLRFLFSIAILLVFVLLISRELNYLLLIIISILVNLVIAVVFYYALDLEIHLYSLAGITISLGIIIDNSIVMIDHLRNKGDKKVMLSIIAATLTTIGALSIIFLLKEEQRVNLIDFAFVIAINLAISILIALYFIPALMEKIRLKRNTGRVFIKRKKRALRFTRFYGRYMIFSTKFRWAFLLVAIFGFGIPVHWLPEKVEGDGFWENIYNKSLGAEWFKEGPKPAMEKVVGGALRLFTEFVFENSFYSEPERTTLHVRGTMPEGCTIEQLNEALIHMENFISRFEEVELFKTSITSYRNSDITIYFKEAHEWGSFPSLLKSELESKAISLGGLDWSVYGVGRGFSNALHSGFRNSRIQLEGYNYDQLYGYAEYLKKQLLQNPRIKEVDITGPEYWHTAPLHEYFLDFYDERLAVYNLSKADLYGYVKGKASYHQLNPAFQNGNYEEVVLQPDMYKQFDVWSLDHTPLTLNKKSYKFGQFGNVEKRKSGNDIFKQDQQYRLSVAYDFIGPDLLSRRVREEHVKAMSEFLPLGFTASEQSWKGWQKDDKGQYYLILLVMLIIFVVCSILFESFRQPLAIIALIPISFIGVFMTFYLFDINFDQGGFASFIMVSGLVVNSGIYIINDYNNLRKENARRTLISTYLKAYNAKIIPILLTLLSSVLGLVPFLWNGQNEVFWFAFAAGAVGGLVFSLVAVVCYLPLFLKYRDGLI